MIALGIETSCDETAVAVTKNNKILGNSVSSSVHLHKDFGGVVPEIACRYHVEYINYVLRDALRKSRLELDKIDLFAVTDRPGLIGALLVGRSLADALSLATGAPVVSVDHLLAHLYAAFVNKEEIRFPFIGLVVSGGHTSLFRVNAIDKHKLLGQTADDAAGEAFDKVATLLNLGYPGGPAIEKRAKTGKADKKLFHHSGAAGNPNFSFSGLKTAVLYHVRDRLKAKNIHSQGAGKAADIGRLTSRLGRKEIDDIAASFQDAVTDILTEKAIEACKKERLPRLVLGGGVAANALLRKKMARRAAENGIELLVPSKKLCLDNAAMVAGLGSALYKKRGRGVYDRNQ